jgi:catechol 2,3-dioxygenase-like lactoylglutathione lyase family enzyme
MTRGLDHVVHAVRDLDAAAALYRSLGFTVGARNRHPWGTHNNIIQFPGCFIELLTLAEPEKLGSDGISVLFGAYTGNFLKRGEGLSLLILESRDAGADETVFRRAGIAASPAMRFEREGKRPDGTPVKVAFSLAFAEGEGTPDIRFAVCQQHFPENFWNPAFQKHANGTTGINGLVVVATTPAQHRDFMLAFIGATAARDIDGGFAIDTPRGSIEVVTPAAFLARYGVVAPDVAGGARLAALRFAVADPGLLQGVPEEAGMAGADPAGLVVVGAADAMGAVLVFERGR